MRYKMGILQQLKKNKSHAFKNLIFSKFACCTSSHNKKFEFKFFICFLNVEKLIREPYLTKKRLSRTVYVRFVLSPYLHETACIDATHVRPGLGSRSDTESDANRLPSRTLHRMLSRTPNFGVFWDFSKAPCFRQVAR